MQIKFYFILLIILYSYLFIYLFIKLFYIFGCNKDGWGEIDLAVTDVVRVFFGDKWQGDSEDGSKNLIGAYERSGPNLDAQAGKEGIHFFIVNVI